jgi:hypothetical protein
MKSLYCCNIFCSLLANFFLQAELNKAAAENGPVKSEEVQADGKKSDKGTISSKHHSLVLEVSKLKQEYILFFYPFSVYFDNFDLSSDGCSVIFFLVF